MWNETSVDNSVWFSFYLSELGSFMLSPQPCASNPHNFPLLLVSADLKLIVAYRSSGYYFSLITNHNCKANMKPNPFTATNMLILKKNTTSIVPLGSAK